MEGVKSVVKYEENSNYLEMDASQNGKSPFWGIFTFENSCQNLNL